uniref:Uncharacterized protein n=1 Tax=Leersia perrieri TaxID=77586 RepID=A0A0D9WQR8_9ORYZ
MEAAGKGVKSLIMCLLVLCLVQEMIHVEAKSCCPSTTARNMYNSCRLAFGTRELCSKLAGCKIVDGKCKPPFIHHTLHSDSDESDVLDFCKLGCASSVCSNINTFVGNEEGNDSMECCNEACNRFCTKEAEIVSVVS